MLCIITQCICQHYKIKNLFSFLSELENVPREVSSFNTIRLSFWLLLRSKLSSWTAWTVKSLRSHSGAVLWLMLVVFCSYVSGGSERAAGKPSVSLRSQQSPVNIPAQLTTHSQTLKCKEKTTFCLCFLRDMNIRFLCLSLQECLQQGWHRDTVLKRWVSSKEPEPRNSNGVVLLTYWFFWSFPGRAYWSWTHWSCRTTRTCADSSESEFQFWNIQHSSTDITITNIYYSHPVHFLSDWVTLCSHENNFTGC